MKYFCGFQLDAGNECLWRGEQQVMLPPKPFLVLRYLVEHPGRLITHDELLDALWPETFVQPQVLRTYVLDLRKALGDDAGQPRFIQTVMKRGYRFVAAVEEMAEGARGRDTRSERLPEPATGPRAMVGRGEERRRLEGALAQAARGQRQIVFVSGEAGIGKTALVDTFCGEAARWGPVQVARGQCVEGFGRRDEYYPVTEALGGLCLRAEGERVSAVLARMAPAWLAGLGREPAMHATPLLWSERKPGDLCAALEEMATETPLVLVLEDMQWSDAGTLQLLSALARRRAPAKLLVLATCGACSRPEGEQKAETSESVPQGQARRGALPVEALKQNLLMRQLCAEIALAPLQRDEVEALLKRELQAGTALAGLTAFVHHRSEGNPLFAIAIAEHLVARGFLARSEDGWVVAGRLEEAEAEVPERLAQMIEVEMEGLSSEEQQVLGAGSVMGIAFPAWAVAAALGEEPARMEEICDRLARRVHFVERGGEDELPDGARSEFYVFVHGLYREVLYRRQAAARRAQWHGRIADRLGELFRGREAAVARERSMHYEAAGDWRRASAALCAAAVLARERRATAEVQDLVKQALRMAERLAGAEQAGAIEEIHGIFTKAEEDGEAQRNGSRDWGRNLTKSGRILNDRERGDGAA